MSASAARAAYAALSRKAPATRCHRYRSFLDCRACSRKLLAVDAASIDIDNAQATERPYRGPSINLLKDPA